MFQVGFSTSGCPAYTVGQVAEPVLDNASSPGRCGIEEPEVAIPHSREVFGEITADRTR